MTLNGLMLLLDTLEHACTVFGRPQRLMLQRKRTPRCIYMLFAVGLYRGGDKNPAPLPTKVKWTVIKEV
jgi:hypothetical protein